MSEKVVKKEKPVVLVEGWSMVKPPRDTGTVQEIPPKKDTGAGIISPYVGVTGFMDRTTVKRALALVPANSNRKLMVGVLASSTTLKGQPNQLPGRFPKVDQIGQTFIDHPMAFNVVHFATREKEKLVHHLTDVVALAPHLIHGIQLNMVWPDAPAIRAFRLRYPRTRLILQVGPKAFDAIERDPERTVSKLDAYKGTIDYVLLDDSGGYGKVMDAEFLLPFVRRIKSSDLDMQIVVAGGLSGDNLKLVTPIVEECHDVSIDAEGRVRDDAHDRLDIQKVCAYVTTAFDFFPDY